MIRKIVAYKTNFPDFMASLQEPQRMKIRKALLLFSDNQKIPSHYIKFLEDGIYEFRVTHLNSEFRILFIYDGDNLVILFNGFVKETQKIPRSEIEKAKKLKQEYYEDKAN